MGYWADNIKGSELARHRRKVCGWLAVGSFFTYIWTAFYSPFARRMQDLRDRGYGDNSEIARFFKDAALRRDQQLVTWKQSIAEDKRRRSHTEVADDPYIHEGVIPRSFKSQFELPKAEEQPKL